MFLLIDFRPKVNKNLEKMLKLTIFQYSVLHILIISFPARNIALKQALLVVSSCTILKL